MNQQRPQRDRVFERVQKYINEVIADIEIDRDECMKYTHSHWSHDQIEEARNKAKEDNYELYEEIINNL